MVSMANPLDLAASIVRTAFFGRLGSMLTYESPICAAEALEIIDSLSQTDGAPFTVLAARVVNNHATTFKRLHLQTLQDASFLACSRRYCHDPFTKMLLISFFTRHISEFSTGVLLPALVGNLPWCMPIPLPLLLAAPLFAQDPTFTGTIGGFATNPIAKMLYALCCELVLNQDCTVSEGLSDSCVAVQQLFQAGRGRLHRHLVGDDRESFCNAVWALCVLTTFSVFSQISADKDSLKTAILLEENLLKISAALTDAPAVLLSPETLSFSLGGADDAASSIRPSDPQDEYSRMSAIIKKRGRANYASDVADSALVASIKDWQRSPNGDAAQQGLIDGRELMIRQGGRVVRKQRETPDTQDDGGDAVQLRVPDAAFRRLKDAVPDDDTYTNDSYSHGLTFGDIDVLHESMMNTFGLNLIVQFCGRFAVLADDEDASVKLETFHLLVRLFSDVFVRRLCGLDSVLRHLDGGLAGRAGCKQQAQVAGILASEVFQLLSVYISHSTVPMHDVLVALSVERATGTVLRDGDNYLDNLKSNSYANTLLNPGAVNTIYLTPYVHNNLYKRVFFQIGYLVPNPSPSPSPSPPAEALDDAAAKLLIGFCSLLSGILPFMGAFSTVVDSNVPGMCAELSATHQDTLRHAGSDADRHEASLRFVRGTVDKEVGLALHNVCDTLLYIDNLATSTRFAENRRVQANCLVCSFRLGCRPFLAEMIASPFCSVPDLLLYFGLPSFKHLQPRLDEWFYGKLLDSVCALSSLRRAAGHEATRAKIESKVERCPVDHVKAFILGCCCVSPYVRQKLGVPEKLRGGLFADFLASAGWTKTGLPGQDVLLRVLSYDPLVDD